MIKKSPGVNEASFNNIIFFIIYKLLYLSNG